MLASLTKAVRCLASDRRGVTALEYGLIASLVAVGIISGLTALKGGLNALFATIVASL